MNTPHLRTQSNAVKKSLTNRLSKIALAIAFCGAFSAASHAGVELINTQTATGTTSVVLGGYAKVDIRHVNGDIAYQDYWIANFPSGRPVETSHTGFNVRESRVNFKVSHGDAYGFIEFDFYGGGGNEVVSNSSNDRLRHFYLGYKNWMIGQNWSTFMPLAALPESLDFGGPHVGEAFIRQTQIRYTTGNWQFAVENPETNGNNTIGAPSSGVGGSGDDIDPKESIPDFVARYNYTADWGQISVATLARQLDQGGIDETAFAANVSGRIKVGQQNDFRFQVSVGEPGRYVAAGMTPDIVVNEFDQTVVEQTTAFTVAYRHFWTGTWRSTAYYGAAQTDVLNRDRNHFAVNLITDVTDKLNVGVELGRYAIEDEGMDAISSAYLQFSTQFKF